MEGVFISYRHSDGGGWAGRLNDHLALRFGDNVIWRDVNNLEAGKKFLPQILKQIKASDAVLVVIGPHWLKDGRRRLQDPEDVLRVEIAHALKSRAVVIPVRVGGASMPESREIPKPIRDLVALQGIELTDLDWARGMQLLFELLQDVVRGGRKTEPLADLHTTLDNLQKQYFSLLLGGEPQSALTVAGDALKLLDEQMPAYPHDHFLQLFRGYFLKNRAMALRDTGEAQGFETSLREAERTFRTIQAEAELYLSNAYNGIGSVTLLQGKFQTAVDWIDKALALVPNHPYALQDRQEALKYLEQAKATPLG